MDNISSNTWMEVTNMYRSKQLEDILPFGAIICHDPFYLDSYLFLILYLFFFCDVICPHLYLYLNVFKFHAYLDQEQKIYFISQDLFA